MTVDIKGKTIKPDKNHEIGHATIHSGKVGKGARVTWDITEYTHRIRPEEIIFFSELGNFSKEHDVVHCIRVTGH